MKDPYEVLGIQRGASEEEIKKILPHRDHMLLIDEAELREGKAYGKKTIRGDEFFLQGHFPGNPVVPGVTSTASWQYSHFRTG